MSEVKPNGLDVESLRAAYPALRHEINGKTPVYFDNACTALKPRVVSERLADFYANYGGCGGKRSTHLLAQETEQWWQGTRKKIAAFLNAEKPEEIIYTSGTTEGINIVARAFPYEDGRREVVITEMEHNSVLLPFYEAAQRGEVELKICPIVNGRLDIAALEKLVTRKTALIAMAHSSNVIGGVFPVTQAARIAHAKGAKILIDDAQYLASHRHDVRATNVDFVAFSAHKIGGPFGIGALYGKEHLLNRLGHNKIGGGTVKDIKRDGDAVEAVYLDAPMRFEAGVQNFGGAAAFGDALDHLTALPQRAVRSHIEKLVRRMIAGLQKIPQVKILGDPEVLAEGSLVSFYPTDETISPRDFALYINHELPERYIALRVGEHCAHLLHKTQRISGTIRTSFAAYNTEEEVDFFLAGLASYIKEAMS
jgi:cysteine desulfurase/selenocysteine lyase